MFTYYEASKDWCSPRAWSLADNEGLHEARKDRVSDAAAAHEASKKKQRVWRVVRSLCTARKDGVFDAAAAHEARKKTVLLKARWKDRVCLSQVPFWWVAHPSTHSCFKNKNLLWYFVAKHYFLSANMPCNWKAGLWLLQMHSHIGCASVKFCLGLGLSECKGYMWYYIYYIQYITCVCIQTRSTAILFNCVPN